MSPHRTHRLTEALSPVSPKHLWLNEKISAQISSYTLTSTIKGRPKPPLNPDYTAWQPVYMVKVTSMALRQGYDIIIFKYILFIIMGWTS